MPLRFFIDENKAQGLPQGTLPPFQAGVSNTETDSNVEQGLTVPWFVDPENTWVAYNCWLECHLDSGMALHRPLPQKPQAVDTLSPLDLDDAGFASSTDGVKLKSSGSFADLVQRVATSEYRFALRGYAVRAGYKVPIPSLKSIGGVTATPERQQAHNVVVGNLSGVPLYLAVWEIWYIVALPPKADQAVPDNLAEHIAGDAVPPPDGMQVPCSEPDAVAAPGGPQLSVNQFFTRQGG